ncbi:MAG: hypothetical protein GQ574_18285 [Crocinitomix sp.]|nr:hypothetical protein [Crocinitomix sp.]
MKYIIEKGSMKKSKWLFIFIGFFLIILGSYDLYNYLQTNEFIYKFPGDWDKVLLIIVGIFLIIRSRKFVVISRDLFIEISTDQLVYRVTRSESVRKIALSNIEKIQKNDKEIIITTKDLNKLTIADFNKARIRDDKRKSITKSLIDNLNPIIRTN